MEASNYKLKIGDKAPYFKLMETDGREYTLNDYNKDLLVVFFTCNHCPYAQAYEDRINKLVEEYEDKADFLGINSNDAEKYPEDSYEEMKHRKETQGLKFYYLWDESQEVAEAYGGECTPHFFVFDKNKKLQYQGRMDDNWQEPENVENAELKDAIESLLSGKEPDVKETNAIGCSIKWK